MSSRKPPPRAVRSSSSNLKPLARAKIRKKRLRSTSTRSRLFRQSKQGTVIRQTIQSLERKRRRITKAHRKQNVEAIVKKTSKLMMMTMLRRQRLRSLSLPRLKSHTPSQLSTVVNAACCPSTVSGVPSNLTLMSAKSG